jgi:hypothetical protein
MDILIWNDSHRAFLAWASNELRERIIEGIIGNINAYLHEKK